MPKHPSPAPIPLRRMLAGAALAAAGTALLPAGTALAADPFPAKEIRLIVPWNAGGSNDIAARALSEIVSRDSIKLVVENVPGATGSIGMQKVAIADPDGYTVGMGTSSTLALIAQGLTPLRNEQFAPIARVTIDPLTLLVHTQAPATSLDAFITLLKQNPGKITIGTPGTNNLNHIFAVMSGRVAGVDIVNVPYPGGAKVVTDLAAKQLDAAVLKPSESKAIQSDRFRSLAADGGAVVDDLTGDALTREIDAVQKSIAEVGKKVFVANGKK